jgi:hypothetical protein
MIDERELTYAERIIWRIALAGLLGYTVYWLVSP